jgi:pyridoxine/pyridoxamine 5'-phosphate oxidase
MSMANSAPVPPEEVADEAWRRLSRAADDAADPLRILTLGTVTPEGRPATRLMLLRGADRASGRIWCHSRRESAKIADLRANPVFAAIVYDAADAIQIRLCGSARIHELDEQATDHFEQSIRAKQTGQSIPQSKPDPIWPDETELLIHRTTRASRKHFAVIEMLIESIDWTQVAHNRIIHVLLAAESQWQPQVVP